MVKLILYKTLLIISALHNLNVWQMNVVTAFLFDFLNENIYVKQPHYFIEGLKVCCFCKALYDLKQSSQIWYMIFMNFLHKLGFYKSRSDYEVFIFENQSIFLAVYVNDLLFFDLDTMRLDKIQHQLSLWFKMTDFNEISHYLNMIVNVTDDFIFICQIIYIKKILNHFKIFNCNSVSIFMITGLLSTFDSSITDVSSSQKEWYQSAIKSLIWLSQHIWPDISFTVAILSKYCSNSSEQHCKHIQRVLAYLNITLDCGLTFIAKGFKDLIGYSNSDFADAIDGCKSTEVFIFMLAEDPISHQAKQQSIVVLSSYEVKYIALCEAGKKAIWLNELLSELGQHKKSTPIVICDDNQSALTFTDNSEFHCCTKHIDLCYHWLCEQKEQGLFITEYVFMKQMAADDFTKLLPVSAFQSFIGMLGLYVSEC